MDYLEVIAYIQSHDFKAWHIANGYIGVIDNNGERSIVKGYGAARIWLGY